MKKLLFLILILGTATAGSLLTLPYAVSTDSMKTAFVRQLSTVAGGEITVSGPVSLSVFPAIAISVSDARYAAGDGAFVMTAARTRASVDLIPLLSGQVRITGISLDRPMITMADAAATQAPDKEAAAEDIFVTAAGYLERLAIDSIRIRDGAVIAIASGDASEIASAIDLDLSAPGIDRPVSAVLSAMIGETKIGLEGELGALRPLLDRKPASFSMQAELTPPPHPALAELDLSGDIQLAADGAYRVSQGRIASNGQAMRLDAHYLPGSRPYIRADIEAGALDYATLEPATGHENAARATAAQDSRTDLSFLTGFDLDFALGAVSLRVGEALAEGIAVSAKLRDGRMDSSFNARAIAGGELSALVNADFNRPDPEFRAAVRAANVDVAHLSALAGQDLPATGRLQSDMQLAFLGTAPALIGKTLNARGTAELVGGTLSVPELAELGGEGAGVITGINARAEITDIDKPVSANGSMDWNGEAISFSAAVGAADLMAGRSGSLALDFRARPVEGTFIGTLGTDGSARGKASLQGNSLNRLLGWIGSDPGTPLGSFAYSGDVAAEASSIALAGSRIALDDMEATGSASIETGRIMKLRADLSVNAVDFEKLTGGESSGQQAGGPQAIDLAMLRGIDADLTINAGRIGYGDVKAGPATARLTVRDSVARLSVPQAVFYDGAVAAEIVADGSAGVPAIAIDASMAKVDSLPLLSDAAGFRRIEGRLDASLSARGTGTTTDALARSLASNASVRFGDGALRGIDVAKVVGDLRSILAGGFRENEADRTEFTEMSVSFAIANGVAATQDVRLAGPLVRMDGQGSIDLAAHTIDMRLNPRVVGSLDGQGGQFDVSGLGMPVIVKGPLSGPRIYPDLQQLIANPQMALRTIENLGGNLGKLGDIGKLVENPDGIKGILQDGIENRLQDAVGELPKTVDQGLVDTLTSAITGNNQQERTGTGGGGGVTGLVGSLFNSMLGRGNDAAPVAAPPPVSPQVTASIPPAISPPEQLVVPVPQMVGNDAQATATVVLPDNVPVPTPSPRRLASTPLAAQPAQIVEKAVEQAVDGAVGQAVQDIVPQIAPDKLPGAATDLINGLLNRVQQ